MFRLSVFLLSVILVSGCSSVGKWPEDFNVDLYASAGHYPLTGASHDAAKKLVAGIAGKSRPNPLLVATVVNINDLGSSSAFGRVLAEQLSAGFTQSGFDVIELKYRGEVYIRKSQGELVLSRDIADLANRHNANAVLAGTYSVGSSLVFVNVKLVRHKDSVILASHDYTLPLDQNIRTLLLGR